MVSKIQAKPFKMTPKTQVKPFKMAPKNHLISFIKNNSIGCA